MEDLVVEMKATHDSPPQEALDRIKAGLADRIWPDFGNPVPAIPWMRKITIRSYNRLERMGNFFSRMLFGILHDGFCKRCQKQTLAVDVEYVPYDSSTRWKNCIAWCSSCQQTYYS